MEKVVYQGKRLDEKRLERTPGLALCHQRQRPLVELRGLTYESGVYQKVL
jgi:hypothetical protein